MKPVKRTQTKLKNLESIKIKGVVYKFEKLHYDLTDKDFFEITGVRFKNNNELTTLCLLKTLSGFINNGKFTYQDLNKILKLNIYLQYQDNVNFINESSLKINNKKYYNFKEESLEAYASSDLSINDLFVRENYKFEIDNLQETCIIQQYSKLDNFEIIPIYYYYGKKNDNYMQIISILEIVTNILTKAFPSFEVQLHNISTQELNKAELINSTLEDITKLSKEQILELYQKEHQENLKLKERNKSYSYEETKKLYNSHMKESELFREEFERYNIDTQYEFINNYQEGDKIYYNKTLQTNLRLTSSVDLGNKGEQIIKELLENLGYKPIDKSKVAHSEDLWIINEEDKIIFLFEVKNKKSISKEDLVKFNKDMTDITNLYQDYSTVGIFINLLDVNISSDIKKFKVESNKIYLTLNYISEELIEALILSSKEHIKEIRNIPSAEDNTKFREDTKNKFNIIQTKVNEAQTILTEVSQEISSSNTNNSITSIENSIINYIKNNKKWTKKYIIEELDPKHIIVKTNWNKTKILSWYNSKNIR